MLRTARDRRTTGSGPAVSVQCCHLLNAPSLYDKAALSPWGTLNFPYQPKEWKLIPDTLATATTHSLSYDPVPLTQNCYI